MSKFITATAYLQLKADRAYWGTKDVVGARILKLTQNKPEFMGADTSAVKVRITVPVEAFDQIPVIDIELPVEALTQITGSVEPV